MKCINDKYMMNIALGTWFDGKSISLYMKLGYMVQS
jgi:hypothetical protein